MVLIVAYFCLVVVFVFAVSMLLHRIHVVCGEIIFLSFQSVIQQKKDGLNGRNQRLLSFMYHVHAFP